MISIISTRFQIKRNTLIDIIPINVFFFKLRLSYNTLIKRTIIIITHIIINYDSLIGIVSSDYDNYYYNAVIMRNNFSVRNRTPPTGYATMTLLDSSTAPPETAIDRFWRSTIPKYILHKINTVIKNILVYFIIYYNP